MSSENYDTIFEKKKQQLILDIPNSNDFYLAYSLFRHVRDKYLMANEYIPNVIR